MEKKNAIARANRRHLLEPASVISFAIAIGLALLFKYLGMHDFSTGYYLASSIMIAQVLFTRKHKVIIKPSKVIFIEPLLMSSMIILIGQLVERF